VRPERHRRQRNNVVNDGARQSGRARDDTGGATCVTTKNIHRNIAFEPSRKRRKGFPSETSVKRGTRVVHGDKELVEKLGRNDLCPCGSGRRFQELLSGQRRLRRHATPRLLP
jgi:hypothetical protein